MPWPMTGQRRRILTDRQSGGSILERESDEAEDEDRDERPETIEGPPSSGRLVAACLAGRVALPGS